MMPSCDPTTIFPRGVSFCPDAKRYLEKALGCLAAGLLVSACAWTERALDVLNEATDGPAPADSEEESSL